MRAFVVRVGCVLGVFVTLFALLFLVFRPWFDTWGTTREERARTLPGDELLPDAREQQTRAITIHARPHEVFAWIAQLGQDRGGFYSYRILENVAGGQMPEADGIHQEWQTWKEGDALWLMPKAQNMPGTGVPMRLYVPDHALVFGMWQPGTAPRGPTNVTWSFVVEPIGDDSTRLLVRGRAARVDVPWLARAFDTALLDPMHFVMERKMMASIKLRAEGHGPSPKLDALEVASWTVLVLAFGVNVVQALRGKTLIRSTAFAFVFGLAFQVLTFGQPGGAIAACVATFTLALFLSTSEGQRGARVRRWFAGSGRGGSGKSQLVRAR